MPSGPIASSSPGATSRISCAPIVSSAQLSEATAQPSDESAEHQRANAPRVARGVRAVASQHHQAERAAEPTQRVPHAR